MKGKVDNKGSCGRKVNTMTTRINLAKPVTVYQVSDVLMDTLPYRAVITDIEVKFVKVGDKKFNEIFNLNKFTTNN